jgi:hypothetical protein
MGNLLFNVSVSQSMIYLSRSLCAQLVLATQLDETERQDLQEYREDEEKDVAPFATTVTAVLDR